MLDYRRLLLSARPIGGRGQRSFADAFDELVAELRRPRRRHHPPVEYVRPQDALKTLRDAAAVVDAKIPGELGVAVVRDLMLNAYPRVFELTDGPVGDNGRRVVRVATAAAWTNNDRTVAAVMTLEIATASARVTRTEFMVADIWVRTMRPGNEGYEDRFELAKRLAAVAGSLARPIANQDEPERPQFGLWIGRPPDRIEAPPKGWEEHIRAVGRTLGLEMRVVPYPKDRQADIDAWIWGHHVDLIIAWAPQMTPDVYDVLQAFGQANPGLRPIVLGDRRFGDAADSFWVDADTAVEGWVSRPARPAHEIPADKVAYLQKKGSARDYDTFTVRAGPCTHDNFQAVHHADKGSKGVERMYGVAPKTIFKCFAAGCSCWMARFE